MNMRSIRSKCDLAGLKQKDIAALCEVTQQTVSNWFTERTPIPLEAALKIRDALGVTLDELCGVDYSDDRMLELTSIYALLSDSGRDYLLQQARFAYMTKDYR